jgi:hypothetical protein
MPPEPGVTFPERRFIVTRTDAGVETNVINSTPLSPNYTSDQLLRGQMHQNALDYLAANPGVLIKVYGPTNGGYWTDGDVVWRSDIDYGPGGGF